ncbi:hypothetical protein CSAL01_02000 [Colletotrichum salicis]|uniref:F-box domain-containing protein n=1 Tax=Colletotrichum salicis TaxID=1209931 RepID=A0A135TCL6_9PEZI|nr:hypothetical protein CSAL01_02000 [Colletotrichum salicis]
MSCGDPRINTALVMEITRLPCEIIAEILGQLDKVQDLKALLLSCRLFHDAYTQRPSLAQQIVRKQIPIQLLPQYREETLRHPESIGSNQLPYDRNTNIHTSGCRCVYKQLPDVFTPTTHIYEGTHDLIVDFAFHFAGEAWTAISDTLNDTISTKLMPNHLDLSQKERLRFCRCFYRVELYHGLLANSLYAIRDVHVTQGNQSSDATIRVDDKGLICQMRPGERLLTDLAPWEIEQLGAATEYLINRFMTTTKGLLTNDISIDKWDTELDASLQGPNLAETNANEGPQKGLYCIWSRALMHYDDLRGPRERAYVFWDQERWEKYSIRSAILSSLPIWLSPARP